MKQLKFLFIVHIGILVSTTFTSCGSDDGPYLPSKDEQYEMWLEDVTINMMVFKMIWLLIFKMGKPL